MWAFCGARTWQREQPRHVVNINADTIPLQHNQFAIRCDVRTATVHSCTDCTAHRMINVQRRIKALPKPCGSWQKQTLSTCSEAADDVRVAQSGSVTFVLKRESGQEGAMRIADGMEKGGRDGGHA